MVKTWARLWLARLLMKSSTNGCRLAVVEPIEQATAFPHRAADRDLFLNHIEDTGRVNAHVRLFRDDRRQRAPALEADLETHVRESQEQAVRRALRAADGHHPRNPAPDRKILVWVEKGIGQGADVLGATFCKARIASSATGSQASSGMTCGISAGVSSSIPAKHGERRDRDRAIEAT